MKARYKKEFLDNCVECQKKRREKMIKVHIRAKTDKELSEFKCFICGGELTVISQKDHHVMSHKKLKCETCEEDMDIRILKK